MDRGKKIVEANENSRRVSTTRRLLAAHSRGGRKKCPEMFRHRPLRRRRTPQTGAAREAKVYFGFDVPFGVLSDLPSPRATATASANRETGKKARLEAGKCESAINGELAELGPRRRNGSSRQIAVFYNWRAGGHRGTLSVYYSRSHSLPSLVFFSFGAVLLSRRLRIYSPFHRRRAVVITR